MYVRKEIKNFHETPSLSKKNAKIAHTSNSGKPVLFYSLTDMLAFVCFFVFIGPFYNDNFFTIMLDRVTLQ